MGTKSGERLRKYALVARRNPDAWRVANDAAARTRVAIEKLVSVVGLEVAADYLTMTAATLREAKKLAKRRKVPPPKTALGRAPRDWFDDFRLKQTLLNPPKEPNGRPIAIMRIARFEQALNPRWRNTSVGSVRQHLTRLKREALAEALKPMEPGMPPRQGNHPNALAALMGLDAPLD